VPSLPLTVITAKKVENVLNGKDMMLCDVVGTESAIVCMVVHFQKKKARIFALGTVLFFRIFFLLIFIMQFNQKTLPKVLLILGQWQGLFSCYGIFT
jgi:hypothetical protein